MSREDHRRIRVQLITGTDVDAAAQRVAELTSSDDHEDPAVWQARLMSICAVQEFIEHMFEDSDAETYERVIKEAAEAMLQTPPMPGLTAERCGLALRAALAVAMSLSVELEKLMPERSMPSDGPPMGPRPKASE